MPILRRDPCKYRNCRFYGAQNPGIFVLHPIDHRCISVELSHMQSTAFDGLVTSACATLTTHSARFSSVREQCSIRCCGSTLVLLSVVVLCDILVQELPAQR